MMEKKYARLAALLAAAVLCGNGAPSMAANIFGTEDNGWHIVIDSDYNGDVYGNKDQINPTTGTVTGHVEMTGGTVTGQIFGGYSYWDAATGNTVTISDGTVSGDVYGGYSYENAATGNTVTITGGSTVENSVYGGWSGFGAATGNTVTISDGTVSGDVYGGYSYWGAATGNTVTISDGTVSGDVYGGYSYWGTSAISGNTVTITGGTVKGNVYGGWGYRDTTDNRVTITGGTVKGNVYGGSSNRGAATGNTVALSGSADVMAASLYGSNKAGTGYENTLLIDGWSGSAKAVKNFNKIQFQHLSWQKEPVLKITGGDSSDLNTTTIAVEDGIALAGGQTFERGESMTLIQREGGLGDIADLREEKQIQLTAGVTTELAGTLSQKTGGLQDVVLTIDSARTITACRPSEPSTATAASTTWRATSRSTDGARSQASGTSMK